MPARFSCRKCGYEGAPEDVLRDFAVCPSCGAVAHPESPALPAAFQRSIYRYGARVPGLAPLVAKLGPRLVRDEADRPIARVQPRRAPLRRLLAVAVGSVVFVTTLVAYAWLLDQVGTGWTFVPLVLGVFLLLGAALAVVCSLSPGPDVLLVAAGRDPRLLLRVRPTKEGWARTTLAVEDGDGVELGTVELDRLRNVVFPLAALGPVAWIAPAEGTRILAQRRPAWAPGIALTREGGEVVGTLGCNPGLFGPDELRFIDPPPVDPRLFVAAMMVLRP